MASKNKIQRQDIDAIAEVLLEKQRGYLEPRLAEIQQAAIDNEKKLAAIHEQLASITASLSSTRSEVNILKVTMESNSTTLDDHGRVLQDMEAKLADMEDRNRRCNLRCIGLKEGLEGSNAIQYLSRSLPVWFPKLAGFQIEIMRAHRVYSGNARSNAATNRTLIFNVLRYTTRQAILQAARKNPLIIEGRKIRFSPDYSNYTVKRRQAFHQVMNTARNKGLDFFLLYPATLKIKEGSQYRAFTSAEDAERYVDRASTHPTSHPSPHLSPRRPGPAMTEALDTAPDD